MRGFAALAASAAALVAGIGPDIRTIYPHGRAPQRSIPRGPMPGSPPTNGAREVARRLRQIQNGQLKVT